jgi:hypothetical protein
MPASSDPSIDPRRRLGGGDWAAEGWKEAIDRSPEFGRDFFARLFAEFPSLKEEAVFLRRSEQPGDVYALFGRAGGFYVLIDADLEYLIIVSGSGTGEHGDWGVNDRTQDALAHVRSLLGGSP